MASMLPFKRPSLSTYGSGVKERATFAIMGRTMYGMTTRIDTVPLRTRELRVAIPEA